MRRNSQTWEVFTSMCDTALDVSREVEHILRRPSVAIRMDLYEYRQMVDGIERAQRCSAERRLKQQNLLEIERKANKIVLRFSTEGKIELLKYVILRSNRKLPGQQRCLVTFDIPEAAANVRKVFRTFLREAGFTQLHRSVWVTRKDVVGPMKLFIKKLQIASWTSAFVVS